MLLQLWQQQMKPRMAMQGKSIAHSGQWKVMWTTDDHRDEYGADKNSMLSLLLHFHYECA